MVCTRTVVGRKGASARPQGGTATLVVGIDIGIRAAVLYSCEEYLIQVFQE